MWFVHILYSYKELFFLIGMALGLGMTVRLGGNICINGMTQACVQSQYLERLEGIHTFCDS